MKLTRFEHDQLYSIGNRVYGDGVRPYWWGKATMPKLAALGLVEPHPDHKGAWRITAAGRELRAQMVSKHGIRISGR